MNNDKDPLQTPPKKKRKSPDEKKEKVVQKFREAWLTMPEFKNVSVLEAQAKTKKHLDKVNSSKSTKMTMTQFVQGSYDNVKLETAAKNLEIKLTGFFADHDIAFNCMNHLIDALKDGAPDSKIMAKMNLKRTKATAIVRNVIGETESSETTQKLLKSKFSILTDESTDISCVKTSCVLVRYYDEERGCVVTKFWDLVEALEPGKITSATAEHLYQNIISSLEKRGIPKEYVIGFASDGCNVMMGAKNSVASRFRRDFPNITIMKCICHSLHLCACQACAQLSRTAEDLACNIYNFFKSSAKRQCEFAEFQDFTETERHQLLHPSQTRWLSLTFVVERILEQWSALQLDFNEKWLELKLVAAESIHNSLNDPSVKLPFLFLKRALPKFTDANKYFQSSKVVIVDLHDAMVELYKHFLHAYMNRSYLNRTPLSEIDPANEDQFLPKHQMYLRSYVMKELQTSIVVSRQDYFHETCQNVLIQACMEIRKRYDFLNPIMEKLKIFKPKNALSHLELERTPTLIPILSLLPSFPGGTIPSR
ncbi:uncharacterized protein LOC114841408 [Diachasma alloeum]|uniref:uncharacterized protein LOC114841408 n=1 Tax=Diachasma alloeum TaxID=454923 RepID=UPI0010FB1651|nr:uncharacterized protein LOC114841408 [Diachasma alloeum]